MKSNHGWYTQVLVYTVYCQIDLYACCVVLAGWCGRCGECCVLTCACAVQHHAVESSGAGGYNTSSSIDITASIGAIICMVLVPGLLHNNH